MRREKISLGDGKILVLGLDDDTRHQILQISIIKGSKIQAFTELNQAEANSFSNLLQSVKAEMA
jgi:hypothetical protein